MIRIPLTDLGNKDKEQAVMDRKKQVLIVTNEITEDEVVQIRQSVNSSYAPQINIQLTLVHVLPRFQSGYFNISSMNSLVERCYAEARRSLQEIGKRLGVAQKDQWLISGKIRTEVLQLANRLGSNFILASAQQIQDLQRSLFFKNIHQYAAIKNVNQIKKL